MIVREQIVEYLFTLIVRPNLALAQQQLVRWLQQLR